MVKKTLIILMWIPMIILGSVLAGMLFDSGSLSSNIFTIVWPLLNFYVAYKTCEKGGRILVIRMLSFFLVESSLVIILLRI